MGTQEYIKGCLIAVGSVFFANGVQLMFTDNCHFVFGTTIAVFGILLILKGFKLKSEADKFFGYLKEAQEYAEHKSQIEIRNDCSNEEQEKLGLDLNSYMKFETTIANALGCFYKKGEALKIILDIHSFTQPRFVGGMLTKTDVNSIKETYGRLCVCLKTIGDHVANRRREFEFLELKRYSYFLKTKAEMERNP